MKAYILALILLVFTTVAFAQVESPTAKMAADRFIRQYNTAMYDSIFGTFTAEMQHALPIDKTREFLSGLTNEAGKIKAMTLLKYQQPTAIYKTAFEKTVYQINFSTDAQGNISGLYVKPFQETNYPKLERNLTPMALPFKGEWTVVWGGDTKELNYHVVSQAQKNAFDIVMTDAEGKSYKTDGKTNADYYAFGQELYAPCDGKIVLVVDGVKENVPGVLNPVFVPGNTVIIETAQHEFLFFAHFKQHSIVVKEGQRVKRGQLLGLCGNTGNSSEPHIHFHIQNVEDMNVATGAKCYFDKLKVNGEVKQDYSPIQKDKISPAGK